MKEKIFEKMIEYGWNLGNNEIEDFNEVYDTHYNFIDSCYDTIKECDDNNQNFSMVDIKGKNRFRYMIEFMSDFLRALNEVDE